MPRTAVLPLPYIIIIHNSWRLVKKIFHRSEDFAERPRRSSAVLLNGAPWEPLGNSVSSPEKLKPVYLPQTHGSPKRVNLQNAGGRILAVSHSTAPISSYKRVALRATHCVHHNTCGLWLDRKPVDVLWTFHPSTALY